MALLIFDFSNFPIKSLYENFLFIFNKSKTNFEFIVTLKSEISCFNNIISLSLLSNNSFGKATFIT